MKRIRLEPKVDKISDKVTAAAGRVQRLPFFGPPPLLPGEDATVYDELVARICAAVEPVDIIDEILLNDFIFLEWDILRLRRVKASLLKRASHESLEGFLRQTLDYDLYAEAFLHCLTETLQDLSDVEDQEEVEQLAQQCAESRPDAIEKVENVLRNARLQHMNTRLHMDDILDDAKTETAQGLVERCARREPDALKQVNEFLASKGLTMTDFIAEGLADKIADIEQIDRSMTIAETRRNASLREIDRRRTALGQVLRRNVQDIEDGEFKVIERAPAAKGKSAA
jgi:hypothetical protein